MKSEGVPFAKCKEFQRNPKGHPLQHVWIFNEVLGVSLAKYIEFQ
jgi:hypothetical protein